MAVIFLHSVSFRSPCSRALRLSRSWLSEWCEEKPPIKFSQHLQFRFAFSLAAPLFLGSSSTILTSLVFGSGAIIWMNGQLYEQRERKNWVSWLFSEPVQIVGYRRRRKEACSLKDCIPSMREECFSVALSILCYQPLIFLSVFFEWMNGSTRQLWFWTRFCPKIGHTNRRRRRRTSLLTYSFRSPSRSFSWLLLLSSSFSAPRKCFSSFAEICSLFLRFWVHHSSQHGLFIQSEIGMVCWNEPSHTCSQTCPFIRVWKPFKILEARSFFVAGSKNFEGILIDLWAYIKRCPGARSPTKIAATQFSHFFCSRAQKRC